MGENTKIEWCHHTFNPWRGCTKVSEGCAHCYAEALSHRNPSVLGLWGDAGTRVVASESAWGEPLKWDRKAREAGERHRVFCASLADVFEVRDELVAPRRRLARLIWETPDLDWLLLTKRPKTAERLIYEMWFSDAEWPRNYWIGTSVENQKHGLPRIDHLRKIPAAIRFLSVEPLLEDLGRIDLTGIDWVIVGGESGPHARPMHPAWVRSIRDQCIAAGVAFFFKQWGEFSPVQPLDVKFKDVRIDLAGRDVTFLCGLQGDDDAILFRVGKKAAGRMFDGRTWDEYPDPKEISHAK